MPRPLPCLPRGSKVIGIATACKGPAQKGLSSCAGPCFICPFCLSVCVRNPFEGAALPASGALPKHFSPPKATWSQRNRHAVRTMEGDRGQPACRLPRSPKRSDRTLCFDGKWPVFFRASFRFSQLPCSAISGKGTALPSSATAEQREMALTLPVPARRHAFLPAPSG